MVEESQDRLDGAGIGLEMLWRSPKGVEVKGSDPRLVEKSLGVVSRLRPDKSAINLMGVVIKLLINLLRGDKGEVGKDAVFIFEEVNDFFLRRKVF